MTSFVKDDAGKYYYDANNDNVKGTCDAGGPGQECFVDVYYNVIEGSLKGTYTSAMSTTVGALKSQVKAVTKAPVVFTALYDFGDAATFQTKVDNSMAGQMRDCAECHVGGGAMEYVPVAQGSNLGTTPRVALRTDQATTMVGDGHNTFNYYIDQYDEDSDGNKGEVLAQNYGDTGVLEMDCLMCHMEGYSWDDRAHAIRKGNFDASRVAGAGLGDADNADGSLNVNGAGAGTGYGKLVTYDGLMVESDGGNAVLSAAALNAIEGTPPSANCAACHFDMHKVDWKKRGTSWDENMAYETEVHGSLGCMGCHTRDDGLEMDPNNSLAGTGDNPLWTGNAKSGTDAATLGHDPSKGKAPFSSLWNANDGNVRTCAGCHTAAAGATYYGFGGAPDPTARHEQLGFTQTLIQTGRSDAMVGTPNGSHLDLITCEGCHTKKMGHGPISGHGSMYEWGTGGALVDSTGPDAEGRLTDHENLYVERIMENNLTVAWEGNKIGPRNALVTMFWRDKDELFGYGNGPTGANDYIDINADGQTGAMDAVNPSHVRNAMELAALDVLTHDGVIDDSEITAQMNAIKNYLPTAGINYDPGATGTDRAPKLKLSFMGVFFKANHGTTPASNAWGSGGCTDCHGADKGFYNGAYDLKPVNLNAAWDNKVYNGSGATVTDDSAVGGKKPKWKHVVPFTKVNKSNYSGRNVSLPICSSYYGPSPRPAAPAVGTLADIDQPCTNPDTGAAGTWTVYPLGAIKADYQFSDFHPTIWAKGQTGRSLAITAAMGTSNTIRTMDRSEGLWEANFTPSDGYDGAITGVNGTEYTTRTAWVSYLNTLGNYRPAIHEQHKTMSCSDCHWDGNTPTVGANQGWALASDTNLPAEQQFTFSIHPVAGTATCATACHGTSASTGIVTTTSDLEAPDISKARISVQHAIDANYSVTLSGSASTCYNVNTMTGQVTPGTKNYAWTITGATASDTCTGNDVAECDVTWDGTVATNNVTLAVTCGAGGGTSSSTTLAVTGYDVGAGDNTDPSLDATVAGNTVTLEAPDLDSEVADVQILWGDYTRLTITDATTPNLDDLVTADGTDDVTHTYSASGTYSVTVVTTNDGDPNNARYTYTLSVVIP